MCLITGLLFLTGAAAAEEKITNYDIYITVHEDASMTVTEEITVIATGKKIKRDIYRDFPTKYNDRYGNAYRVAFEVLKVLRDGENEPYFLKGMSNGKRLYIGQEDVFLAKGEYTYTISFKTDHQLVYFDDYDELYWNATGHGWDFTIDNARVEVELPEGAEIIQHTAYTGRQGADGKAYSTHYDEGANSIVFTTSKRLPAFHGLTIAIGWPKGLVREPSAAENSFRLLRDNVGLAGVTLIFFGLLIYYYRTWFAVGIDPSPGPIIPLFEPPKGFSPAATAYVLNMGFPALGGVNTAFGAAVVNMAVKGVVQISKKGKHFTLEKVSDDISALSSGEKAIDRELFSGGKSTKVVLKNENHATVAAAMGGLRKKIRTEFEKLYFLTNANYIVPGVLLTVVALGAMVAQFVITAAPSLPAVILFVLIVVMDILFYNLLKAPTIKGRRVMDRIEGFKMYLSVAEQERYKTLHPPQLTPVVFEKYLPYALALGVEHKWSTKFAAALGSAALAREYRPAWYVGTGSPLGTSSIASSLGDSMTSAISSSSSPPGSSSGSGGGGFSGGGGGGGGGGGW